MTDDEARKGPGRPTKADKAEPRQFKIPPDVDAMIDSLSGDLSREAGRPVNRTQVVLRAVRELRERTPRPPA